MVNSQRTEEFEDRLNCDANSTNAGSKKRYARIVFGFPAIRVRVATAAGMGKHSVPQREGVPVCGGIGVVQERRRKL